MGDGGEGSDGLGQAASSSSVIPALGSSVPPEAAASHHSIGPLRLTTLLGSCNLSRQSSCPWRPGESQQASSPRIAEGRTTPAKASVSPLIDISGEGSILAAGPWKACWELTNEGRGREFGSE